MIALESSSYDSNGNTLTKVVGSNTTSYAWDFENRMTSVTLPGSGGTVTFKYDAFGRRIYKSSSTATSIYAFDGDNLVEETNASGVVVGRYTQTDSIDEPLAMVRGGTTSYYEADGLGSITSLSSSVGAVALAYGYDSFGKQTSSSGSLTNPFQFIRLLERAGDSRHAASKRRKRGRPVEASILSPICDDVLLKGVH